jgi:hypothetical protein
MLEPSGALTTYTDPTFGFSFRYPSIWHLRAPEPVAMASPDGYGVGLTNYNPIATKRQPTAEEIRNGINI